MSEMLIKKIERYETPFVQMEKTPLFSSKYSWAEKGMLATLLACKSGDIKLTQMQNFASEGEKATRTIQSKLKAKGHLVVVNEGGNWYSEVYEIPVQTPVLTYERRQKQEHKLTDILKKRGISAAEIVEILEELEGEKDKTRAVIDKPDNTDSDSKPKGEATSKQHGGAGAIAAPAMVENKPTVSSDNVVLTNTEKLHNYVAELKADSVFLSETTAFYDLQLDDLGGLLNEFLNAPPSLVVPNTKSYIDFSKHFFNWIPKRLKGKKMAENIKKKPSKNGVVLPTHDEIKTELQRSIKMVYSVQDEQFTYFKESVLSVIMWATKAEKLKITLDEDTTRKATFYLDTEGASEKRLLEIYNVIVKHNKEKEGQT